MRVTNLFWTFIGPSGTEKCMHVKIPTFPFQNSNSHIVKLVFFFEEKNELLELIFL